LLSKEQLQKGMVEWKGVCDIIVVLSDWEDEHVNA